MPAAAAATAAAAALALSHLVEPRWTHDPLAHTTKLTASLKRGSSSIEYKSFDITASLNRGSGQLDI